MSWEPNHLEQERLDKLAALENGGVVAYPARVQRTHTAAQATAAYEAAERSAASPEDVPQIEVTVAGRIRRLNVKGKVSFLHIEDQSGRIQLFLRVNDMDEAVYNFVREKLIEADDFVQASGTLMRTQAGEISVRVAALALLSKALSPLPVIKQQKLDDGSVREFGEFSDMESRYRQRYADLAVNHDVRDVFIQRAQIIRTVRQFMDSEGLLEVETPVLQPLYGGAAARPFITHHNQLDQDLYLRISFELYLKRLLVGGFDGVYEIGRDFRNEGVSFKHNTEFTMLEFYKAYIDYNGVMNMTERMLAAVAQAVHGSTRAPFQGEVIDYAPPWPRLTVRDAIRAESGIDYMDYRDAATLEAVILDWMPAEDRRDFHRGQPWGKLIEHLLGAAVEKKLIQPTFILDYPRDISPFAKRVTYDDVHVERFEFYIAGMEMGNAFTELNDPRDQQARFEDMARLFREGDVDAAPLDEDYLRAMRYGMPPNGGFGMGVDRLVMLMTDQRSIRDVLLYPHLKRV
ncbi:MAG TPA: lysine--tRNA ligase [Candidatus Limnocylindrales bacterium]|nr:lysine--tRNA ligase [Candidatus Limnocylindrales bacterium]